MNLFHFTFHTNALVCCITSTYFYFKATFSRSRFGFEFYLYMCYWKIFVSALVNCCSWRVIHFESLPFYLIIELNLIFIDCRFYFHILIVDIHLHFNNINSVAVNMKGKVGKDEFNSKLKIFWNDSIYWNSQKSIDENQKSTIQMAKNYTINHLLLKASTPL